MYEASFMSTNTVATLARKIAQHGHPEVNIRLDHHNHRLITYSTGDSLSGEVSITAPHTARFDEVEITLQGLTQTHVENMTPVSSNSRIDARHPFLRLTMPIPESDYPQPRIAEAGQTYKFPFNFVIPQHLLLTACRHNCAGDHVHDAHLNLPPSMGDKEMSPSDDLSPDMARIVYAIRVRVLRNRERDGKIIVLTDRSRKIRVIPTIPEAPPMHIPADDKEYCLSVTKQLRKGMFAGKMGKITVSASQTKSLAVPSTSASSETTIMATLKLRFEPSEANAQPPRLGGLSSKIKASTFYAVKPFPTLASRTSMLASYDLTRGVYSTSTSLATRCVENVPWMHHLPQPVRRDSGYSTASGCSSDSSSSEVTVTPATRSWYEANIPVPLTLPKNKTWLPTFHSCLVSRVYSLEMSLSVHTPGTGVPASTISLRLPVQISSGPDGTLAGDVGMAAAAAAREAAEVEDYLRPRIISVPGEEFVMGSTLPVRTARLPSLAESTAGEEPRSLSEGEEEDGQRSPVYTERVEQRPVVRSTLLQSLQSQPQQARSQSLSVEAPPGYDMHAPRWGVVGSDIRRGSR